MLLIVNTLQVYRFKWHHL